MKGQGHRVRKTVIVAWLLVGAAMAVLLLQPAWDCASSDCLLAICCPSGCTVMSGVVVVVVVVVVGVCNHCQMRTSKCTCLIFGVSIGLDPD